MENVRDSLTDWARETPIPLSVHRVGGPRKGPPRTEAGMARLAADLQGIFAIRWQGFVAPVENALGYVE